MTSKPVSKWYQDWQSPDHAVLFDSRSRLADRPLVRNYESFSDVRLLQAAFGRSPEARLLEVGCATGEFYRYLRVRNPRARYHGMDISETAVTQARRKYPQGIFFQNRPEAQLQESLQAMGLPRELEILYSKDVVHHQTDPYGFLDQLIPAASEAVVLRLRTRDQGSSVMDPELSCQYHYHGWMPYIVLNIQELADFLRSRCSQAEIVLSRNYRVLGGRENRFLPKECYLPETGTAETAVGLFKKTSRSGDLRLENREEMLGSNGWKGRLKSFLRGGRG